MPLFLRPRAGIPRRSRPLPTAGLALAAAASALIAALGRNGTRNTLPLFLAGFRPWAGVQRRPLCVDRQQALRGAEIETGEKVQVLCGGYWYDSEVTDVGDGSINARFDFDCEMEEGIDISARVRRVPQPLPLQKCQRMEVEYEGVWYGCAILEVGTDGKSCTVKYDHGGDEEPGVDVLSRIRTPRVKLKNLDVGQKLRGTVIGMSPFGVYVDVAAEVDGLVHISRIAARDHVKNIEDHVMMGQEIDVWVWSLQGGRLGLTMMDDDSGSGGGGKQPQDHKNDLTVGQKLHGTVVSVHPFGIFVDIGVGKDGLVHVTQIAKERVKSIEDHVETGQKVDVWVLSTADDKVLLTMIVKDGGGRGRSRQDKKLSLFAKLPTDKWFTGVVARTASYGAFVTLTLPGGESADGLVHISQIRDAKIDDVNDELNPGQKVRVKIVSVDLVNNKMALSMRH